MYKLTGDREKDLLILERLINLYRERIDLDNPADDVWTDYATSMHYRLERQYEELQSRTSEKVDDETSVWGKSGYELTQARNDIWRIAWEAAFKAVRDTRKE